MRKSKQRFRPDIRRIHEPMLSEHAYYINCKNCEEFEEIAKRKFDLAIGKVGGGGGFVWDKKARLMLFWAPKERVDLVAHECMHVVVTVLKDMKGIPLTESTEEVYAYLIGFLFKEIYR